MVLQRGGRVEGGRLARLARELRERRRQVLGGRGARGPAARPVVQVLRVQRRLLLRAAARHALRLRARAARVHARPAELRRALLLLLLLLRVSRSVEALVVRLVRRHANSVSLNWLS